MKAASAAFNLSDEALNRILDKVGSLYVPAALRIPKSEERDALRRQIEFVPTWYEVAVALGSKAHSRRRRQSLQKILSAAQNLEKALSEERAWREIICWLPLLADSPRANVKRLIEIVSDIIAAPEPAADLVDSFRLVSPREWVAVRLVHIFDRHFKKTKYRKRKAAVSGGTPPPGRSRSPKDGQVGGPCVEFVDAAMTELQMPFSRESIVRAMTRARSPKPSRRKAR
jgi:hypothetical protein